MGNKSIQKQSHESKTENDFGISIKHFPLQLDSPEVKGTLDLQILEPFVLELLDPFSPDGFEKIELDVKVYYAGKGIQSEMQKKQKCAWLTKKTYYSAPNLPEMVFDESDKSINLKLTSKTDKPESLMT